MARVQAADVALSGVGPPVRTGMGAVLCWGGALPDELWGSLLLLLLLRLLLAGSGC